MRYGGPHAEVNAILSVSDSSLLRESILYVNLEPCSHTGKTPPCADLIISSMEAAIADKIVTYDFARLMEGAKEVKCSAFGQAMIERM